MKIDNPEQYLDKYPDNVAVIGGGRWARVLTEVLCGLVPPCVKISVHSLRNAKGMTTWASERGLEKRISVISSLPTFSTSLLNAVIVVNAANDHEKTVEWALSQGYPVLVEKPLCLNFLAAQQLANLALTRKVFLATAHVFLFASYVEKFSSLIVDEKSIKSINVLWMDPQSESRYGEAKSYDPGLTVFADWLPHILSILGTFINRPDWLCEYLDFLRGGAHLKVRLVYDRIPCSIELVRNGDSRQRKIEVTTQKKSITLDFGKEPGTISADSTELCGDSDWNDKPKPVAGMLLSFLQGATGGNRDARLDVAIGLSASQVIDQITSHYRAVLFPWLNKEFAKNQIDISSDLRYALVEILQMEDPGSSTPMGQRIDYIYRNIKKYVMHSNDKSKQCTRETLELIIKQGKSSSYLL